LGDEKDKNPTDHGLLEAEDSQHGLDPSYLMRFWDIFSLATDTKEIGSLQRRPDAKAIYSSFLAQSHGSAPPIAGRFGATPSTVSTTT
jgi:hypothetical protein